MKTKLNYRVLPGQSKGRPNSGSRGRFSAHNNVSPTHGSMALKANETSPEDSFESMLKSEFSAKPVVQTMHFKTDLYAAFHENVAKVPVEQKAIQALDGYWA